MTVWNDRELDQASAEALAIVTLYASGSPGDLALATDLLDELTANRASTARIVGGLVSIAGALLALHEWDTGTSPEVSLQMVGTVVASALMS